MNLTKLLQRWIFNWVEKHEQELTVETFAMICDLYEDLERGRLI